MPNASPNDRLRSQPQYLTRDEVFAGLVRADARRESGLDAVPTITPHEKLVNALDKFLSSERNEILLRHLNISKDEFSSLIAGVVMPRDRIISANFSLVAAEMLGSGAFPHIPFNWYSYIDIVSRRAGSLVTRAFTDPETQTIDPVIDAGSPAQPDFYAALNAIPESSRIAVLDRLNEVFKTRAEILAAVETIKKEQISHYSEAMETVTEGHCPDLVYIERVGRWNYAHELTEKIDGVDVATKVANSLVGSEKIEPEEGGELSDAIVPIFSRVRDDMRRVLDEAARFTEPVNPGRRDIGAFTLVTSVGKIILDPRAPGQHGFQKVFEQNVSHAESLDVLASGEKGVRTLDDAMNKMANIGDPPPWYIDGMAFVMLQGKESGATALSIAWFMATGQLWGKSPNFRQRERVYSMIEVLYDSPFAPPHMKGMFAESMLRLDLRQAKDKILPVLALPFEERVIALQGSEEDKARYTQNFNERYKSNVLGALYGVSWARDVIADMYGEKFPDTIREIARLALPWAKRYLFQEHLITPPALPDTTQNILGDRLLGGTPQFQRFGSGGMLDKFVAKFSKPQSFDPPNPGQIDADAQRVDMNYLRGPLGRAALRAVTSMAGEDELPLLRGLLRKTFHDLHGLTPQEIISLTGPNSDSMEGKYRYTAPKNPEAFLNCFEAFAFVAGRDGIKPRSEDIDTLRYYYEASRGIVQAMKDHHAEEQRRFASERNDAAALEHKRGAEWLERRIGNVALAFHTGNSRMTIPRMQPWDPKPWWDKFRIK